MNFKKIDECYQYLEQARLEIQEFLRKNYPEYRDLELWQDDWLQPYSIIAHYTTSGGNYSWDETVKFTFEEVELKRSEVAWSPNDKAISDHFTAPEDK